MEFINTKLISLYILIAFAKYQIANSRQPTVLPNFYPLQAHEPVQTVQSDFPYYPSAQPRELINLGSQSPFTTPCATILTLSNCILRIPDDGIHKDVSHRAFIFAAALVKDQCSLTVQECPGSYRSIETSTYFANPSSCYYANSVCCECNGCTRSSLPLYDDSCAVLYENIRCSLCHGFSLHVGKEDIVDLMHEVVDNKVSSIYVVPGCELTVYTEAFLKGGAALAQGAIDHLPNEWNDIISSYKCTCKTEHNNDSTTTVLPLTSSSPTPPIVSSTTTTKPIVTTPMEVTVKSTSYSYEPPTSETETVSSPATTSSPIMTTTESALNLTTTKQPISTSTMSNNVPTLLPPSIKTTASTTVSTERTTTENPETTASTTVSTERTTTESPESTEPFVVY